MFKFRLHLFPSSSRKPRALNSYISYLIKTLKVISNIKFRDGPLNKPVQIKWHRWHWSVVIVCVSSGLYKLFKKIYISWTLARFFLNSGPGIGLKSHCAFLFIVVGFHHCLDYGFHLFYMCRKSKWHKVKRLGAKAAVVRVKT